MTKPWSWSLLAGLVVLAGCDSTIADEDDTGGGGEDTDPQDTDTEDTDTEDTDTEDTDTEDTDTDPPDPFCGDGSVDEGEDCDDGNVDPGDGCSTVCFAETVNTCVPTTYAPAGGEVMEVDLGATIGVVARGAAGIEVLDVSDLLRPVVLSRFAAKSYAYDVALVGDVAWMADAHNGLVGVDLADPNNPVPIGHFDVDDLEDGLFSVAAVGADHVAVSDTGGNLVRMIDVSDPSAPFEVATAGLDAEYYSTVDVTGSLMAVPEVWGPLRLFEVSDPAAFAEVGVYSTGYADYQGHIVGDVMFVPQDSLGFDIVDISAPSAPTRLSTVNPGGGSNNCAWGGEVDGDRLLLLDYCNGAMLYDVSTPTTPALLGTWLDTTTDWNSGSGLVGDVAYLTQGDSLTVVDFSGGTPVMTYQDLSLDAISRVAAIDDRYVVGAGRFTGLHVFDVANPSLPINVATVYGTGKWPRDLTVAGDRVYITRGSGQLQIVDVSDPLNPVDLGHTTDLGTPVLQDVAVIGDVAYVTAANSGISVLDVSNPADQRQVGYWQPVGLGVHELATDGTRLAAYVADGSVALIDTADPTQPAELGRITLNDGVRFMRIEGDRLYAATSTSGLLVIDISDPTNPTLALTLVPGGHTPTETRGLTFAGGLAHIVDGVAGTWVYDLSDLANPVEIAHRPDDWGYSNTTIGSGVVTGGSFGLRASAELQGLCEARCGNSVVEWPESCDDGNHSSGDGCDATCSSET